MSGMNTILKEFAEAQQALELVPQLRDEIRKEREENLRLTERKIELADKVASQQSTIGDLLQTIARLEVERDDASFREMAAADQLASIQSNLGALIDLAQTLKPKAEPTAEAEQKPVESMPPQDGWKPYERLDQRVDETISSPVGESASSPTNTSTSTNMDDGNDTNPSTPKYEDQDTIDPNLGFLKPSQPYAGMEYYQKPIGVSTDDFVAGGGTAPSWYVKPSDQGYNPFY